MEVKKVGLACDHAGFPLKQFVLTYLEKKGYPVEDFGTYSDQSVDYADFAHKLADAIESGDVYPGIGICGSGEGMAIALNKHHVIGEERRAPDFPGAVLLDCGSGCIADCAAYCGDYVRCCS